ncbi:MAG: hypothetical protein GEV11_24900 [Streptosporangiales bacterium]|nr:hypothetical protein [Streptosporangiales bacterium]
MTLVDERQSPELFSAWADRRSRDSARRRIAGRAPSADGGVRFAFYGRTSTLGYQDRWTSHGWQREAAESLIAGAGVIVADYFDAGVSREVPWGQRPRAAALLEALADPGSGIDAVVVGEFERAFSGDQYALIAGMLEQRGTRLWIPEAGGPVDLEDAAHRTLLMMLGAQSRREVLRARYRVLAAMRIQACEQGRYLGGRPPYGYRLVDAGPHPNRVHAAWGRRLQRLDPDPVTASTVRWIFAYRLAGVSVAGIARELNERGVPCPSRFDRERNPHRSGEGWVVTTVAAILENPRYTGREVWNRHASSSGQADSDHWAVSARRSHPALVSDADFVTAQKVRAARPTSDGSVRRYLLAGLLICGYCRRRMDSHWVNERPGYRCRHGHDSAKRRSPGATKYLYRREDHLLAELGRQPGVVVHQAADQARVAAQLRSGGYAVVCDRAGCTIVGVSDEEPGPREAAEAS